MYSTPFVLQKFREIKSCLKYSTISWNLELPSIFFFVLQRLLRDSSAFFILQISWNQILLNIHFCCMNFREIKGYVTVHPCLFTPQDLSPPDCLDFSTFFCSACSANFREINQWLNCSTFLFCKNLVKSKIVFYLLQTMPTEHRDYSTMFFVQQKFREIKNWLKYCTSFW